MVKHNLKQFKQKNKKLNQSKPEHLVFFCFIDYRKIILYSYRQACKYVL